MRDLVLIGNSGAARECYLLALSIIKNQPDSMRFKGFCSHNGYKGSLNNLSHLELGSDEDYLPQPNDVFVTAIGDSALRDTAYTAMKAKGATFCNLVSPYSELQINSVMGENNIIGPWCVFSSDIRIGDGNYFNGAILLGHDVTIGNFNSFAPHTTILGNCIIGSRNKFAVGSTLLDKCKVGDENIVAPGSYVYKGCRNNCRMAGNPALRIGTVR